MTASNKHRARKRFGQNFLTEPGIIHRIIRSIDPGPDDTVIEIGPGQGALTTPLSQSGCRLTLVEIDRDLAAALRLAFPDANLVEQDVLKADLAGLLTVPSRVVGNLPYNISTPLLFRLFEQDNIIDMHFMLQLEVVDRMSALPSTSAYGRLSVMTQYYCEAEKLFEVPPEAFSPRPKVNSAIVRLRPRQARLALDPQRLDQVLTRAFSSRRKTVRNALKSLIPEDALQSLGIDPALRPENLTIDEFASCARYLEQDSTGRPA